MRRGIDFRAHGQELGQEFRQPFRKGVKTLLLLGLLGGYLGACAPVVRVHGYLPKQAVLDTLEEGSHDQRQVERLMGSPSTTATFDDETWYYINSIHHTYAWKKPVVVSRQIVAVSFNDESKLISGVQHYSVEDGRLIAFNSDATPTKGREFTFLEQLLGNVGRVSTETFEDKADQ